MVSQVPLSPAKNSEAEHPDPLLVRFLTLLEKDIKEGQHVSPVPEPLAHTMLEALDPSVDLNLNIEST